MFKDVANRFNREGLLFGSGDRLGGAFLSLNVAGNHVMFNNAVRDIPLQQRDIGNLDQRMRFVNRAADTLSFMMQSPGGQSTIKRHIDQLPRLTRPSGARPIGIQI